MTSTHVAMEVICTRDNLYHVAIGVNCTSTHVAMQPICTWLSMEVICASTHVADVLTCGGNLH